MKNPLPISTPFWISRGAGDGLSGSMSSPVGPVRSPAQELMLRGGQGLQLLDKKDGQEPSTLANILQFLKYTPDQITRIEKFIGTIEKVAGTVVWVVGAVSTVKDLLTLVGVLDKDDEAAKLQQQIALTVQTIYSYLEQTEKKAQYELALNWRSTVQTTKTNISNLALSRTQSNLDMLAQSTHDMMEKAILPMLDLGMGNIPFMRATYGGRPSPVVYENELPSHWSDYAFPLWMQTTGGDPVSNGNTPDLGSWIWDPGYYIDVLVEAIGVRIAGLTALEPAFRSTAYDRDDLRKIANGLTAFIDKWEHSLLITNVVGPLDPMPDVWGDHPIHHPWAGTTTLDKPGLPIGVIDPVTGIAAFDPLWNEGFTMHFVSEDQGSLGLDTGYWALSNYDQIVTAAYAYRSSLLAQVREQCGINRMRTLRDSVAALIGPPSPSEFVSLSDSTFARADIAGAATTNLRDSGVDENVDLGIIGQFAGKPGKQYKARRWYQYSVKSFRVPMARRMDYSKTQLGYRLRFTVGQSSAFAPGNTPIDVSKVLTEFTAQAFPGQSLQLFPTDPQTFDLQSDTAGVFDVLQSTVFSAHEEEIFERTGNVPGRRRLFLNRRDGKVSARVKIEFAFDVQNPDSPFVGFATVTVGTLDPDGYPDGFILDVDVYETAILAPQDPPRDERRERPVALMRLHFAPSFLVVEPDYFTDRDAGLKAMGQAMKSINDQYVRSKLAVGPRDPIENIERVERVQAQIVNTFAEYAQRSPDGAEQLKNQFAVPSLQHG